MPPEDAPIDRSLWKSRFASGYAEKFEVGFHCSWHVAYGRNRREKQPFGTKNGNEVNTQTYDIALTTVVPHREIAALTTFFDMRVRSAVWM